jgi:hypothetical protein
VEIPQLVFGALLVVVLLAAAVYFGWKQRQTLVGLAHQENLPPEDRHYMRRQAWRRLIGCGFMVVLAVMVAAWFFLDPEGVARAGDRKAAPWYLLYLVSFLLVLLGIICLAAFDLFAIRRFGLRHRRQIQADRRAMIERQAARLRSQRNGHH